MAEEVISKTTGDARVTRLTESFANMGAPWVSGIRNIEASADEMDLRVIENFKTADLHRAYWPGRRLASPVFEFYSVCKVGFEVWYSVKRTSELARTWLFRSRPK